MPQPLQGKLSPFPPLVRGLYLHVPFCFHKCHYCDFYSIVDHEPAAALGAALGLARPTREAAFASRLAAELELRAGQFDLRPATIFVGGGTPTLLPPATWRGLLDAMRRLRLLDEVEEFTVEANPETVTPELAQVLVAGGVNRVSLGAQSFQPALLKTLERWHDPASVGRAVGVLRGAGIRNINLDLIFAIPGQTLEMLDADLDAVLALAPEHLSYYSLIYEPNTAMLQRLKMGQVTPADEELERRMYERVMARLADAGFVHYEVSNWGKRGRAEGGRAKGQGTGESSATGCSSTVGTSPLALGPSSLGPFPCRHNLLYWENGNWVGVGPAAASHVEGVRWKNVPHLGRYLATPGEPPTSDHEHLPADESFGEQLMLRLRLIEGAPLTWLEDHLQRTGPQHRRISEIDQMITLGLLERTATHLRLTREGLFLANAVLERLI